MFSQYTRLNQPSTYSRKIHDLVPESKEEESEDLGYNKSTEGTDIIAAILENKIAKRLSVQYGRTPTDQELQNKIETKLQKVGKTFADEEIDEETEEEVEESEESDVDEQEEVYQESEAEEVYSADYEDEDEEEEEYDDAGLVDFESELNEAISAVQELGSYHREEIIKKISNEYFEETGFEIDDGLILDSFNIVKESIIGDVFNYTELKEEEEEDVDYEEEEEELEMHEILGVPSIEWSEALHCIRKEAEINQEYLANVIISTFDEINGYAPTLNELINIFYNISSELIEEAQECEIEDYSILKGLTLNQFDFINVSNEFPLNDITVINYARRVLVEEFENDIFEKLYNKLGRIPNDIELKNELGLELYNNNENNTDLDDSDYIESTSEESEEYDSDELSNYSENSIDEYEMDEDEYELYNSVKFQQELQSAISSVKKIAKYKKNEIIKNIQNKYYNDVPDYLFSNTFNKLKSTIAPIEEEEEEDEDSEYSNYDENGIYSTKILNKNNSSRIDFYFNKPKNNQYYNAKNSLNRELNKNEKKSLKSFLNNNNSNNKLILNQFDYDNNNDDDSDYNPESDCFDYNQDIIDEKYY